MISELFLYDRDTGLFKEILKQSKMIAGNYHVSSNYGRDLNANNLESIIKDYLEGLKDVKVKYPMAVCITPKSTIVLINGQEWEEFTFVMYFLTQCGIENNQVKKLDKSTNTSGQHVWYDWNDMKQCGLDFIKTLKNVILKKSLSDGKPLRTILQVSTNGPVFQRVSRVQNDKLNGVIMTFIACMYSDACNPKDYSEDAVSQVSVPAIENFTEV